MKTWLNIYAGLLFFIVSMIALFNYWMDPFWCFNHNHKYNSMQKAINERQQKANYIYFTNKKYDALLLGSSRTTYMKSTAFKGMNVFNFSASAMRPKEYLTYIDFVIKNTKQPIKTIILGVDFFGYLDYGLFMFDNAPSIVNATKSDFYRWKMLLSFDATNNSFKNIRDYMNRRIDDRYDRNLIKIRTHKVVHTKENVLRDIAIYANTQYNSKPNRDYNTMLSTIYNRYNDKKFVIYTTPISEPLFKKMIELGYYHHYENWLRNLVSIYGEVHHFMYINSVTKDYLNTFADSNHAYNETNDLIAYSITDKSQKIPDDFGIVLTKENIERKLQELKLKNEIF